MEDTIANKIKEFLPSVGIEERTAKVAVTRDGFNVKITIEGKSYEWGFNNKDEAKWCQSLL